MSAKDTQDTEAGAGAQSYRAAVSQLRTATVLRRASRWRHVNPMPASGPMPAIRLLTPNQTTIEPGRPPHRRTSESTGRASARGVRRSSLLQRGAANAARSLPRRRCNRSGRTSSSGRTPPRHRSAVCLIRAESPVSARRICRGAASGTSGLRTGSTGCGAIQSTATSPTATRARSPFPAQRQRNSPLASAQGHARTDGRERSCVTAGSQHVAVGEQSPSTPAACSSLRKGRPHRSGRPPGLGTVARHAAVDHTRRCRVPPSLFNCSRGPRRRGRRDVSRPAARRRHKKQEDDGRLYERRRAPAAITRFARRSTGSD